MISIQVRCIYPCTLHQCVKPFILRCLQKLKSLFHKDTILSNQIHHITDRGNRNIFHQAFLQMLYLLLWLSRHSVQNLNQLIRYSCAAQPFKWILTVCSVRIDHCIRRWQKIFFLPIFFQIRNFMVICHNDRHPIFFSVSNLVHCRNSIITGDDRVYIILQCTVDQHLIQSISVFDPVWNIRIHICPKSCKPLLQYIRCIDSINIIITDHTDFLSFFYFLLKNIYCTIHIFHQ